MAEQAFAVAALLKPAISKKNGWMYRGQKAGQYAFENAFTHEWAFI